MVSADKFGAFVAFVVSVAGHVVEPPVLVDSSSELVLERTIVACTSSFLEGIGCRPALAGQYTSLVRSQAGGGGHNVGAERLVPEQSGKPAGTVGAVRKPGCDKLGTPVWGFLDEY